jgi:ribosomal protein S8E
MQAVSRKVRILDVVYNASNNELVRAGGETPWFLGLGV